MTELAKTYGGALFALASEEGKDAQILCQMNMVCSVLQNQPEYVRLMESRALAKADRLALLDEAFAGKVDAYLLNFMKILCERDAFAKVSECRDAFERAYNEKHHIAVAVAVSAQPLSEDQMARLTRALEEKTGKTIKLIAKVDPKVGGGLCVEVEGHRYDNTVSAKLDRLRKALQAHS